MRCKKLWSPLCLMLVAAATAGCASMPGLTSLMPGGAAKPNQTLDAQLSMARLSERHGDARTAEQIYQAVLTKQPQNQLALHRLGVLAAKAGEHDKAAEYFNAAAQLGPPSAELLNDIGFNLFGMGRLQEAEAVFRQAIAADPQNRSARNNLGLVLGETRRYEESLAEFRRGGKGEAEAQANLAYAQTQAGDVAGANVVLSSRPDAGQRTQAGGRSAGSVGPATSGQSERSFSLPDQDPFGTGPRRQDLQFLRVGHRARSRGGPGECRPVFRRVCRCRPAGRVHPGRCRRWPARIPTPTVTNRSALRGRVGSRSVFPKTAGSGWRGGQFCAVESFPLPHQG